MLNVQKHPTSFELQRKNLSENVRTTVIVILYCDEELINFLLFLENFVVADYGMTHVNLFPAQHC